MPNIFDVFDVEYITDVTQANILNLFVKLSQFSIVEFYHCYHLMKSRKSRRIAFYHSVTILYATFASKNKENDKPTTRNFFKKKIMFRKRPYIFIITHSIQDFVGSFRNQQSIMN